MVGLDNKITIEPKPSVSNVSDDIVHALHRSRLFNPKAITVTADAGAGGLEGTVRSPHERQVAANTAWAAPGVTAVENIFSIV